MRKSLIAAVFLVSLSLIAYFALRTYRKNEVLSEPVSPQSGDAYADFRKLMQQDPQIDLEIIEVCNQFYFKVFERETVQEFLVRAELRSLKDSRKVGELSLFTTTPMSNPPRRPDRGWQVIVVPDLEVVSLDGYICDHSGNQLSDEPIRMFASVRVKSMTPNAVQSERIDEIVASSRIEMEQLESERWLQVRIPGDSMTWPSGLGMGAVIEGLDNQNRVLFKYLIVKPIGETLNESFVLTDSLNAAKCDEVTHVRITAAPCLAPFGGAAVEAWDGIATVTLPPLRYHEPTPYRDRFPKRSLVPIGLLNPPVMKAKTDHSPGLK